MLAAERYFDGRGDHVAAAALVGCQAGALDVGLGGARAAGALDRIDHYLLDGELDRRSAGLLHLAAAMAARSARRHERISDAADRAADLLTDTGDDDVRSVVLLAKSWMLALSDTDTRWLT